MITKAGAARTLAKRAAYKPIPLVLRADFPQQNAFVEDINRFVAAQCSRRSGKTNGLAIRFFRTMEKYPRSQCLYLSLTQDSARSIMWPVLQELNDIHKLGCTFVESKLTMTHPNGATLRLMGADLSNFIKRLKGRKYPGVAIDEAQDFGRHLESLIDDVLAPSIADYKDGWIAVVGTPGPVPNGLFFEITQENKYGFSLHKWTLLDNPYMPNPHAFLASERARHEWTETNPTYLREYKNNWVLDATSLWIQYSAATNHYQSLPDITPKKYTYALGIDIGFKDADALAVIAWSDTSPTTYLVEEVITRKQGLTELVEQIQALQKKYDLAKLVIDEGGLGKKLAEEMRRRHAIPVHPADKARKQENVEFFNDALRRGTFKAKSASQFAQDSYLVQIDWDKSSPNKIVIKKHPHSDIIDAVLYIFKESPAYTYQQPVEAPKWGTTDWAKQQEVEMFDNAVEHFKQAADYERWNNGENE